LHIRNTVLSAPTLTFIIGAFGGLIIVFLEFKWLSKSKFGKKLFLSSSTDGISNKELPGEEIIGCQRKNFN